MKRAWITIGLLTCSLAAYAIEQAAKDFNQYRNDLLKKPGIIRLYTFDEGKGSEIINWKDLNYQFKALGGGPAGTMDMEHRTFWGRNRKTEYATKLNYGFAHWIPGRFAGKAALASGRGEPHGWYKTGISGTEFAKGMTIGLWIRAPKSTTATLIKLGDWGRNGFWLGLASGKIMFRYNNPDKKLNKTFDAGFLPAKRWTYLVITENQGKICFFVDGKQVGEFTPGYKLIPVPVVWTNYGKPFLERAQGVLSHKLFTIAGGDRPWASKTLHFSELQIFDRGLAPDEITELYSAGKPVFTAEQEAASFAKSMQEEEQYYSVKLDIPGKYEGFYRVNENIPFTLTVPEKNGLSGNLKADFKITTLAGKITREFSKEFKCGKPLKDQIKFNLCDVYNMEVTVKTPDGRIVWQTADPVCFGILPPEPAVRENLSNVGLWACADPFNYDMPFRRMAYWSSDAFRKLYKEEKTRNPQLRYTLFFYWRLDGSKAADEWNQKIIDDFKAHYKEFPGLVGFEMTSEPKGYTSEAYIKLLKNVSNTFRPLIPGLKIVPPGACPTSLPDIRGIVTKGGAPYIDGISYHPYETDPIGEYHFGKRSKELKEIAELSKTRKLVIWNSESMLKGMGRINGKMITEEAASLAGWPSGDKDKYPFKSFLWGGRTEDNAAALQIQGILCNFAFGYKIYFICQSPNLGVMDPTLGGIALTALSGQVLCKQKEITAMPLANMENMCVLIRNTDNTRIAALFGCKPDLLKFRTLPGASYRTMDMLGNYSSVKADQDGILSIKTDHRPVYVFNIPENFPELVTVSMNLPEKMSENGIMEGNVKVFNPGKAKFDGVLTIAPLNGAEITPAAQKISLLPGETKDLSFKVTSISLKRRDYVISTEVKGLGMAAKKFTSPGCTREIKRLKTPFALDGNIDKWSNIPAYVCEIPDDVVHGKPNAAEPWLPQWLGKQDLSFRLQLAWHKTGGIYFLLRVTDDVLMPAKADKINRCFQYDCLELYIDSRKVRNQGTLPGTGADQALIVPNISDKATPCKFWFARKDPKVKVECVSCKTADGYLIEGRILPDQDCGLSLRPGNQFRMDFLVDDTDAESALRKAVMAVDGGMENSIMPSLWGKYELSFKFADVKGK